MKFTPLSVAVVAALAAGLGIASAQNIAVDVAGETVFLPLSAARSYDVEQDEGGIRDLLLLEDGRNITMNGNTHRAVPFPNKLSILPSTTLDFDFYLGDEEEIHALCIEYNLHQNGYQCFVTGGTQNNGWARLNPNATNSPSSAQEIGDIMHYTVEIGKFFTGSKKYKYLVFVQDNDSEDKSTGSSSFANIALGGYGPDLVVDNENVAVNALMPYQYSMHSDQDTFDNPATVEPDGSSIQLNGNVWRAAPLEQAIEITSETNLDFDFTLNEAVEFHAICLLDASGGAKYDVWNNIGGGGIWDLTNSPDYPDSPSESSYLSGFLEAPANWGTSYGSRISTLITAPVTGSYTFYIASDDQGQLFLSTDADPANKRSEPIASVPSWTSEHQWNKYSSQKSVDIPLVEGEKYYLEALHKEGGGGDNLAIAWSFEGGPQEPKVIPGEFFSLEEGEDVLKQPTCSNCDRVCFHLAGSDMSPNIISVIRDDYDGDVVASTKTQEGETVHYSIPVGLYEQFVGKKINAVGFISDNDSEDPSLGESIFSNITVTSVTRPKLSAMVLGNDESLDLSSQVSASEVWGGAQQDTVGNLLEFSDDGTSIILQGNIHKAITLPAPVEVNEGTEFKFDFTATQLVESHAICLMDENYVALRDRGVHGTHHGCVWLGGPENQHYNKEGNGYVFRDGDTWTWRVGFPFYDGLRAEGTVHHIAFIQDSDADRDAGLSTFSNIELYERPPLSVDVYGNSTELFNRQLSYGHHQDSWNNLISVSDNGTSMSMDGNLHKAFEFPESVPVSDSSVLSFSVSIEEELEIHAICLDEDLSTNRAARCFKFGGYQTDHLGNIITKSIKHTHEGELAAHYLIRLKNFFAPSEINYLAFQHDNDSPDRTTGASTISDIRIFEMPESCINNVAFNFTVRDCTVESFLTEIGNRRECAGQDPLEALLSFFNLQTDVDVYNKIGSICESANANNMLEYNKVLDQEDAFLEEFFDGGGPWNYAIDEPNDVERIDLVSANFDSKVGLSFPDVHNWHGCKLRAGMCCYVDQRDPDTDPKDNSDACYMDFSKARQSSHVRDGYSIYNDGVEGNLNCHGFAWSSDIGSGDAAFRGNTLFDVAMQHGLHEEGRVEELPGAPLCGCIEQMPVVTRADCTKTTVTQSITVQYFPKSKQFFALASVSDITHDNCTDDSGNELDLAAYYNTLDATEYEKRLLAKHLVGDSCDEALEAFLDSKGFVYEPPATTTIQSVEVKAPTEVNAPAK